MFTLVQNSGDEKRNTTNLKSHLKKHHPTQCLNFGRTTTTLLTSHQTRAPVPKRVKADVELTEFLQEEAVDAAYDPLVWWCDNHRRFPLIAKLEKKYMCICGTSTSSERMFSTAGNIVTPGRSGLKPHKVNMLGFLSLNLPN